MASTSGLSLLGRRGPEGGGTSGAAGSPYAAFQRALKRRNVLMALAAAKDLPPLSLADALELTILVARKEPRRHPRTAARWLLRYLEEHPSATIEDAALGSASLIALPGASLDEAAQTLRAMAERASSRRRERGVA
jgi:hypothetical protein